MILGVDPGSTQSAIVVLDRGAVRHHQLMPNTTLVDQLQNRAYPVGGCARMAIEMIASYGMAVGREVFDTCVWIGRFTQAWGAARTTTVLRKTVKMHLCGSGKGKDTNVRTALIDLYGGKAAAVGYKSNPGPLYGITQDEWSALAVAVTYRDLTTGRRHRPLGRQTSLSLGAQGK